MKLEKINILITKIKESSYTELLSLANEAKEQLDFFEVEVNQAFESRDKQKKDKVELKKANKVLKTKLLFKTERQNLQTQIKELIEESNPVNASQVEILFNSTNDFSLSEEGIYINQDKQSLEDCYLEFFESSQNDNLFLKDIRSGTGIKDFGNLNKFSSSEKASQAEIDKAESRGLSLKDSLKIDKLRNEKGLT